MMLLTIGGGAFKQMLVKSGINQCIAGMMQGSIVSPILMAWSIAVALRLALSWRLLLAASWHP